VGNATVVCQICHDYEQDNPRRIHKKHSDEHMDCGSCHADANQQDDRVPMPPIDDERRAQVDRNGWQECYVCHNNNNGSITKVHDEHVSQWQWCYNCHLPDDDRPTGGSGPVTEPAESCRLCHSRYTYRDNEPFAVHERHAGALKCYSCHQTQPELTDWPRSWLGGELFAEKESVPGTPSATQYGLQAHPERPSPTRSPKPGR
jgi:hypothetical protein